MKKVNKIGYRERILALLLSMVMIMAVFPVQVLSTEATIPVYQFDEYGNKISSEAIDVSEATHFIIRHWHSEPVTSTSFQDGSIMDEASNRYFVMLEGYIVPDTTPAEDFGANDKYKFYLIYQGNVDYYSTSTGVIEHHEAGDAKRILPNGTFVNNSAYVQSIDQENGVITLKAHPAEENGAALETFSAFSISAGHSAVSYVDGADAIEITYDPYVHLVKGHAFYSKSTNTKYGTDDPAVFGPDGLTGGNPEEDTAWAYVYVEDCEDDYGTHSDGDLVKVGGKVFTKGDTLPDGVAAAAELVKVYNTDQGLHTDKTATEHEYVETEYNAATGEYEVVSRTTDGRTFDMELNSWYVEGQTPNVGMVLDASGSMAFAADEPEKIQLDSDTISKYNIKQLESDPNKESGGWDNYFLTDEVLNKILNPRNTDNSLLSANAYNYFVLNNGDEVSYAPLAYWEGVPQPVALLEFINSGTDYDVPDKNGTKRAWLLDSVTKKQAKKVNRVNPNGEYEFVEQEIESWPSDNMSYSGGTGFDVGNSGGGILLDVVPTGDFTLTFSTLVESKQALDKLSEILYIGPLEGNADSNYLRFFRPEPDEQNRLQATNSPDQELVIDIDNTLKTGTQHSIALVFSKTGAKTMHLEVYVDGAQANSGNTYTADIKLDDFNIILNGLKDEYGKFNTDNSTTYDTIWIDDFALYDAALTADEIKSVISGSAFTAPTVAKTWAGKVLASINFGGTYTATPTYPHTKAGWYFISHAGGMAGHYENENLKTGKRFLGLGKLKDAVADTAEEFVDNGENSVLQPAGNNTGYEYKGTDYTPIKFYVDAAGYLRCFYSTATAGDTAACSYVYELGDGEYVRTGALQRAIGLFVTELSERSPATKVSAVRFSSSDLTVDQLSKLVLLDWTNSVSKSVSMLSLNYGDGSSTGSETSSLNTLEQYNYGLTGSTSTWRGLQSYVDNLAGKSGDTNASRYLIIFTDGLDSHRSSDTNVTITKRDGTKGTVKEKDAAKELASYLKEKYDYTIFTVLLDGDGMADEQYASAETFLKELAGYKGSDTDSDYNVDNYFFSVKTARSKLGIAAADKTLNGTDLLTLIFTEEVLKHIVDPLEDYAVKDYIDPRFDLVDAKDGVLQLMAGGKVIKSDGTSFTVNGTSEIKVTISNQSDKDAQTPYLRYDEEKNMYYLEWVGQTMPTSAAGASKLSVWSANFTVRAKDDFIAGNAVLTNGNGAMQNYVYFPGHTKDPEDDEDKDIAPDSDPSSGTGDAELERNPDSKEVTDYPSKGFPRTTVNVKELDGENDGASDIYMGDNVNEENISKLFQEWAQGKTENLYWDYIVRYVEKLGGNKECLYQCFFAALIHGEENADCECEDCPLALSEIYNEEDGTVTIPYYYLPDHDGTNQTGTDLHEGDLLGYLTYEWKGLEEDQLGPKEDTVTVQTKVAVTYEPLSEEARISKNCNGKLVNETELVDEEAVDRYNWDADYKPAAGDEAETPPEASSKYEVNVVSGEIVLQLDVKANVLNEFKSELNGKTIKYTADLVREYWYENSDNKLEVKIGTYTATYTYNVDGDGVPVPELVTAELVLVDDTGWDADVYGKAPNDPNDNYMYTYGLPFGTYTLVPVAEECETGSERLSFSSAKPVVITGGDEGNSGLFFDADSKLNTAHEQEAEQYKAPAGNNVAYLGGEKWDDEEEPVIDLTALYALLRVELLISGNVGVGKIVLGESEYIDPDNDEFEFTLTINLPVGTVLPSRDDGLPFGYIYKQREKDSGTDDGAEAGTETDGEAQVGAMIDLDVGDDGGTESDEAAPLPVSWVGPTTGDDGGIIYTGTLKLKARETITVTGIPDGATYTIKETNTNGYRFDSVEFSDTGTKNHEHTDPYCYTIVDKTFGTGTVEANLYNDAGDPGDDVIRTHQWVFYNRPPIHLPSTGIAVSGLLLLIGLLVAAAYIFVFRNARKAG